VRSLCGGRMTVYGRQFARLHDVVVDNRLAAAVRRGGETLDSVLSQPESHELYQFSHGFFTLYHCCDDVTTRANMFHQGNYLSDWLALTRLEPAQVRYDRSVVCSG